MTRGLTILVVALGLLAGSATVVTAQSPEPASTTTEVFKPAFRYVIPASMHPTAEVTSRFDKLAFAEGSDDALGKAQGSAAETGARGVLVMDVTDAQAHPCLLATPGVIDLFDNPVGFLDELDYVAGIRFRLMSRTATVLDGRPALMTMTDGIDCGTGVLHSVSTSPGRIRLDIPSRLIVADVQGATIMVQAWAGTSDGLAEWLPIADEFIESIHFLDGPGVIGSPEPSPG